MNTIKNIINEVNTLSQLSNLENVIKEAIESKRNDLNLKNSALNLSDKSFHCLKETFENMSPELFKTNEGRKILNSYKKNIRENKSFRTLVSVHECFRKLVSECTTNMVIEDINKHIDHIDTKMIDEGINTLRGLIYTSYKLLGENAKAFIAEENENYSNAIRYIVENKKSFKNISDFANATYVITENIKNREIVKQNNNINTLINDIESAFNKTSVKESVKSDNIVLNDKENIFNTYKQECLNKINESFSLLENEDEINKVKKIYEQVENRQYCEDTVNEDVINLIGITKCF